jgi:hypothetical protein
MLQPAAQQQLCFGGQIVVESHGTLVQAVLKCAIQSSPAWLLDFAVQALGDLTLRAWSQPFGGEFAGTLPHTPRDVVTCNDQIAALVIATPEHDVDVRVIGVPVFDRGPFQFCA